LVIFERELILLCAANAPGLHHEFRAFAHRQAGAGFCDTRQNRAQILRAQAKPRRHALSEGLAAIASQQQLLKAPRVDHGWVAHGVDTRGNGALDLAQRYLVAEQDRRFETGAAGTLQIEAGRFRGKPGPQHRLAGQVPLARVLHDRACGDVVHTLALQPEDRYATAKVAVLFLIAHLSVGAVALTNGMRAHRQLQRALDLLRPT
jgi:hypothetical protein